MFDNFTKFSDVILALEEAEFLAKSENQSYKIIFDKYYFVIPKSLPTPRHQTLETILN